MEAQFPEVFVVDGARISTMEEFYDEVERVFAPDIAWGRNLDAFEDLLRGGLGLPEKGCVFRWKDAELSRSHLDYPETIRQLRKRLERSHPENRAAVLAQLNAAEKSQGPTVFDWLVTIIRRHGPGGDEANDGIELQLA